VRSAADAADPGLGIDGCPAGGRDAEAGTAAAWAATTAATAIAADAARLARSRRVSLVIREYGIAGTTDLLAPAQSR
jgi:hypothetical protein